MTNKSVFLTKEGIAKIEKELQDLREVKMPEVAERLRIAKESADSAESPEFESAREEQAFYEARIRTLENMLANAILIDESSRNTDRVVIGSKVTIEDEEGEQTTYTIVGSAEASVRENKLSNESPVGRAIIGKSVGEIVTVLAPAGLVKLKIISIE